MSTNQPRTTWVRHSSGGVAAAKAWLPQLVEAPSRTAEDGDDGLGHDGRQSNPKGSALLAELVRDAEAALMARFAQERARLESQRDVAVSEAERWRTHALTTEAEAQRQGFAAGYAQGEAQGRAEGSAAVVAESRAMLDRLRMISAAAQTDLALALQAAQGELAELSLAVAHTLLGEAYTAEPIQFARRIATLIESLIEGIGVTIRLHPDDLAIVREVWATAAGEKGWNPAPEAEHMLRFIGDLAVEPLGCIIETRTQMLDAQPTAMSEVIRLAFAAADGRAPI